jgi:hypothetical protein
MSFAIHCTKKLLERVKPAAIAAGGALGTTLLGNWYATALFWKPQVALLVNEKTLLPVLMPLAPATDLATRFPEHLAGVLTAHGMPQQFIDHELAEMHEVQYAKTSNHSVVGIMNQFTYLAEGYREYLETSDLRELALKLAHVPCSPLYKSETFPDRELKLLVGSKNFAV